MRLLKVTPLHNVAGQPDTRDQRPAARLAAFAGEQRDPVIVACPLQVRHRYAEEVSSRREEAIRRKTFIFPRQFRLTVGRRKWHLDSLHAFAKIAAVDEQLDDGVSESFGLVCQNG